MQNTMTVEQARSNLMTKTQFSTALKNIRLSQDKFNELVQATGMQTILIAFANEDYGRITDVYNALKTNNQKAFRQWIETYTPAVLRSTKEGVKSFRKGKEVTSFDFEGAGANPWHKEELKSKAEIEELLGTQVFADKIASLIAYGEKALKNNKVKPEEKEAFEAILANVKGLRVQAANDDSDVEEQTDEEGEEVQAVA